MRLIDLSHPLKHGQPPYPGDPELSITSHGTIAENRYHISRISMGSHQGTHLDAMSHFIEGGRCIEEMPLEWFYGEARLIRLPKGPGESITRRELLPYESLLTPEAKIILETGWHQKFGDEAFFDHSPSITQDAARYLAERQIRLLGMDMPTPGADWYELHHILLAPPTEIVVVESLANLHLLPDRFTFAGFPLPLQGGNGSPIRAVALVEDDN